MTTELENTSLAIPALAEPTSWASRFVSAGLALGIFGLLAGGFRLWDDNQIFLSPAFSSTAIYALFLLALGAIFHSRSRSLFDWKDFYLCPRAFCLGLVLVFLTDWLTRGYNLFQGPGIRGELLVLFLILLPSLRFISRTLIIGFAVSSCLIIFGIFLYQSKGYPLLSDDHASFILRLTLLKEKFPNIPFFHPLWNAGLDARDFFATGALSFFFLTAPLQYLFPIVESYNVSVGLVLFIILPLSLAYATQLARVNSPGPALAAILSIGTSLVWYRWGLKYGTMGFITSASLMPIAFMLGCRLINHEKLSKTQFILFIASISLCCMWPLGGVCFLGLAVVALLRIRTLVFNRQIIVAALLLILLNLPWAMLFWKVSKVGSFLDANKSSYSTTSAQTPPKIAFRHKESEFNFEKVLNVLREQSIGTNPLLLFLLLPGLMLLQREIRKPLAIQMLLLLLGGSLLVTIKPQLELDRLLVFLSILAIIPTSKALMALLQDTQRGVVIPSIAFSFLFLTPWVSSNIIHNRSVEAFNFGTSHAEYLGNALKQHLTSGRAVFAGFVMHELDGGHLAPLSIWSQKPLVASSPFHNRWQYTSVFPDSFLERGEEGVAEFLELMNAEVVLAHEPHWVNFFHSRPDQYDLIWQGGRFQMFKLKHFSSTYFIEGSGEILEQNIDGIKFRLFTPDATLKFSYFPFLRASGCKLSAFEAGLEQPLIKLTQCPIETVITLDSVGPFERLMQ